MNGYMGKRWKPLDIRKLALKPKSLIYLGRLGLDRHANRPIINLSSPSFLSLYTALIRLKAVIMSLTLQQVIARNKAFLRAQHSDSEESQPQASSLTAEDLAFLSSLSDSAVLLSAPSLTRLSTLIHDKIALVSTQESAQRALGSALQVYTKGYWKAVMSAPALANPLRDVLSAVLYYSDKQAWLGALAADLDLHRRMELLGLELDAIAEEHEIEVEVRRTERKRNKQAEKMQLKRRKLWTSEETNEIAIPQVNPTSVFGENLDFAESDNESYEGS